MKSLIFLLVLLTPQILTQDLSEEEKDLKTSHNFAKIFLESNLPMYIHQKLRDKLRKSIFDPYETHKFEFKDCEGKEYNSDEFVDNYLLAGKLGENLRIAGIESGAFGHYQRKIYHRTYHTKIYTDLDSYSVAVNASAKSTDLSIFRVLADCKTRFCN